MRFYSAVSILSILWSDWQFAQANLNSLFATFIRYIITGRKSLRCFLQELPGHVHFCMGAYGEYSSRLRNFGGFKLVTNLKETKEAKCNDYFYRLIPLAYIA